jgi:hypothetical protein
MRNKHGGRGDLKEKEDDDESTRTASALATIAAAQTRMIPSDTPRLLDALNGLLVNGMFHAR